MNGYLLTTAALVLGGMAVCGAVAVATGWLLPWLIDAAFASGVLMIGVGGYLQVLSARPRLAA